jgi:hypothetical protein
MRTSGLALGSALAVILAFSAPAHAQQTEITAGEVAKYFEQVRKEAIEILRGGDAKKIAQWSHRHLAEGAAFKVAAEITHEGQPKMWSVIDVEKADIERLQAMLGGVVAQGIENYTLEIEVGDVRPHGNGAATVNVTWSDSGTLKVPADAARPTDETVGQAQEGREVNIQRQFNCNHLVVREEGELKIGLSNCVGVSEL